MLSIFHILAVHAYLSLLLPWFHDLYWPSLSSKYNNMSLHLLMRAKKKMFLCLVAHLSSVVMVSSSKCAKTGRKSHRVEISGEMAL